MARSQPIGGQQDGNEKQQVEAVDFGLDALRAQGRVGDEEGDAQACGQA